MAIFGGVVGEAIRQERARRLRECVARRMATGMGAEDARRACKRELFGEED